LAIRTSNLGLQSRLSSEANIEITRREITRRYFSATTPMVFGWSISSKTKTTAKSARLTNDSFAPVRMLSEKMARGRMLAITHMPIQSLSEREQENQMTKMSSIQKLCILLPLAMMSVAASAVTPVNDAAVVIECPAEIPSQSLSLPVAPAGWTSSIRGPLRLNGVDITSGPPVQKATLLPEIEGQGKKAIRKWTQLKAHRNFGIWIACRYGRSENFVLEKQVVGDVDECKASDKTDGEGQFSLTITCK
jgi:hypothetical protein